jgi:hypothetical protein
MEISCHFLLFLTLYPCNHIQFALFLSRYFLFISRHIFVIQIIMHWIFIVAYLLYILNDMNLQFIWLTTFIHKSNIYKSEKCLYLCNYHREKKDGFNWLRKCLLLIHDPFCIVRRSLKKRNSKITHLHLHKAIHSVTRFYLEYFKAYIECSYLLVSPRSKTVGEPIKDVKKKKKKRIRALWNDPIFYSDWCSNILFLLYHIKFSFFKKSRFFFEIYFIMVTQRSTRKSQFWFPFVVLA